MRQPPRSGGGDGRLLLLPLLLLLRAGSRAEPADATPGKRAAARGAGCTECGRGAGEQRLRCDVLQCLAMYCDALRCTALTERGAMGSGLLRNSAGLWGAERGTAGSVYGAMHRRAVNFVSVFV